MPQNYNSILTSKETQLAIFAIKDYVEENLCKELNLIRVTCPLIVEADSGINDYLDRDGSRTPIRFHISNDNNKNPVDAEIVQAATKWKEICSKAIWHECWRRDTMRYEGCKKRLFSRP